MLKMRRLEGRWWALEARVIKSKIELDQAKAATALNPPLLALIARQEDADSMAKEGWREIFEFKGLQNFPGQLVANYYMIEVSDKDFYFPVAGELIDDGFLRSRAVLAKDAAGWTSPRPGGNMLTAPVHVDRSSSAAASRCGLTTLVKKDGRATLVDSNGVTLGQDPNSEQFVRGVAGIGVTKNPDDGSVGSAEKKDCSTPKTAKQLDERDDKKREGTTPSPTKQSSVEDHEKKGQGLRPTAKPQSRTKGALSQNPQKREASFPEDDNVEVRRSKNAKRELEQAEQDANVAAIKAVLESENFEVAMKRQESAERKSEREQAEQDANVAAIKAIMEPEDVEVESQALKVDKAEMPPDDDGMEDGLLGRSGGSSKGGK